MPHDPTKIAEQRATMTLDDERAKSVKAQPPKITKAAPPAPPVSPYPMPREAIAVVKGDEFKWYVLQLILEDGLVVKTNVVDRHIDLEIAQDAARRKVRTLRG